METPPPIPQRHRQRQNQKPLSSTHRFAGQPGPASPEVISSLITSLSIISSPANQLFEHESTPRSPHATSFSPRTSSLNPPHNGVKTFGGSFGRDYGAFEQPSLREEADEECLDELAASPPVIRTAKPPSGFSQLTAPKSPREPSPLKSFLRGSSRPSSKGSSQSGSKDQDDTSSIGNLSIEPGVAPTNELRRKSSGDSWGKKQGRNQRGLNYMSSKERLRERDQERKRGNSKSRALERLALPQFDSDSFMAETAIGEEPEETHLGKLSTPRETNSGGVSPALSTNSLGGIGSGRFIPTRDSSLRKSVPAKKRSSQRSSHHSGRQREGEDSNDVIHELDEKRPTHKRERSRRTHPETTYNMKEALNDPELSQQATKVTTYLGRSASESSKADQLRPVDDFEDGAPSPTITQNKMRLSLDRGKRSSSQNRYSERHSGRNTPEPGQSKSDKPDPKRSSSRLKRLSAPLSPKMSEETQRKSKAESTKTPQIHLDDRPTSADSIDDAVEAYLCSPRLSQKIRHPQTGRTISFSEVGDSEGHAVFCCVGMGLTRYITAFYDELALTLKLRLITPDRPGVGDSEPYNDGTATPLSWPDDVYAICQALKITKFSILAHSAGAIYALATALRMPQHIRGRIHLLAPWIPPSQLSVFGAQVTSPPTNSIPTSQRILRALPTPILKAANSSFMSATSSSITSSLPKSKSRTKRKSAAGKDMPTSNGKLTSAGNDKENHGRNSTIYPDPSNIGPLERAAQDPTDPNSEAAILAAAASHLADKERQVTYDTRLTQAIWDLATTGANPAVDLLVCLERRHTIGFRYVDITRAVVIHHGSKDTRVPVDNVRWLGKTMRRCEVRVLEGEGHGLMASAAVMSGVLMEIAREWDDWLQVTSAAASKSGEGGVRKTLRERASSNAFRN